MFETVKNEKVSVVHEKVSKAEVDVHKETRDVSVAGHTNEKRFDKHSGMDEETTNVHKVDDKKLRNVPTKKVNEDVRPTSLNVLIIKTARIPNVRSP